VEATFENIKIDYARGYFGNQVLSGSEIVDLDFMNSVVSGLLDLPATAIQLEIENGLKVDAKATLYSLTNTNNSGSTLALTGSQIGVPIVLSSATGSWSGLNPTTETIGFNSGNSNIENYLENLGSQHQINYKIELNPWGNTSGGWNEIFPNSRIRVKLHAQLPMTLAADDLTLKDTFDFDVSQDFDKTHVTSGILTLNATNAFPIEANPTLFLLDDLGNVLYTIQSSEPIFSSNYGSVDPIDGLLKKESKVMFELDESIVNDLSQVKKIAVQAVFNTPNESGTSVEPVSIPIGAFLAVKLNVKFNLKTIL
jgi:hypothetical protein